MCIIYIRKSYPTAEMEKKLQGLIEVKENNGDLVEECVTSALILTRIIKVIVEGRVGNRDTRIVYKQPWFNF